MSISKKDPQQLKSYLDSIVKEGAIEAIADDKEQVMRMTGAKPVAKNKRKKVQVAVEKVARKKPLSDEEAFFVEAIIIPSKRPAVLVKDDDYKVEHDDWLHLNTDKSVRSRIRDAIPAIGRIELPNHPSLPYGGTGFVVGPDLIMTNRHVAEIFTAGLGLEALRFRSGLTAGIDFKQEVNSTASRFVGVQDIVMVHPFWDMALLRVDGLPTDIRPLTLAQREPEEIKGEEIAAIGYPAFDPRNDPDVQREVFGSTFNVKRLQPGLMRKRRRIRSFGNVVDAVTHDASTLGGNSGSAVLDLATGEVIALHFAGLYLDANFAVSSFDLSRDGRVVDAGVEFGEDDERNVEDETPWDDDWRAADPHSEAITVRSPVDAGQGRSQISAGGVSLTIPLVVDVRLGEAGKQTRPRRR